MRNRVVLLLVIGGLALLGLSFGASASADPSGYPPSAYPPSTRCTVSTSDRTVSPGDSLTLTGSGFPANKSVELTMQSGQSLGKVHTDSQGSFTTQVTIPSSASKHDRIVAASSSTTCSLNPNATTPHGTSHKQAGATAFTGFAAIIAIVVALALLAGGVLFVVVGRGRRA